MYSWLFRGVTRGILTLQGGIYEKKFIAGITKLANIAEGKRLLTLELMNEINIYFIFYLCFFFMFSLN
jgi:hypothetical protein